jgi:hypothetical protein
VTERIRCGLGCPSLGKPVVIQGRRVVFWKREGVWWRDEAYEDGDGCGYCGVPSSLLVWNGWAQRKRGARQRTSRERYAG